ncbi:MAG: VWA domain-containing protein [Clostridia bacterium]|nr:VWA domain-containing protein [Clostridia bacterium]
MKRKITSLLLCACMAITVMIPVGINASANDGSSETPSSLPKTADGLTLNKTATPNGDGTYKLTLEAYTTGNVTTTVTTIPTDLVLVLDQSGSMKKPFGRTSRQNAMKTAVKNLINSVSDNAVANNINNRIAIVTFSDNAATKAGLTELYSSSNSAQSTIGKNALKSAVTNLPSPKGATKVDMGMTQAKEILDKDTVSGTRNRVVVVFTDGVPTKSSDFDTQVADNAIATAKQLKDSGTTVYTIGIFGNADKNQLNGSKYDYYLSWDGYDNCNGTVGSKWGKETAKFFMFGDVSEVAIPAGNRFLNYLSSNFADATSIGLTRGYKRYPGYEKEQFKITNNYTRTNSNFYLTASNVAELENVFETISSTISTPTISLGSETVIKDVMSDSFDLPAGASASSIKMFTQNYQGNNVWANRVATTALTANVSGKEVSVTGYSFDDNFVTQVAKADGTYGQKLIIEFDISLDVTSFGGNQIATNAPMSGVYNSEGVVANFVSPKINAPINYDFKANSKSIYISQNANLESLIAAQTGYVPNGNNNAFVDISYAVKQGGATVGTYTIAAGADAGVWNWTGSSDLTGTTDYTIECTVTPKEIGEIEPLVQSKSATVFVFTPQVETESSMANYKDTVNLNDNVSSDWQCEIEDAAVPLVSAPTLSYEFTNKDTTSVVGNVTNYNVLKEGNIQVTKVKANGADVTANTAFDPSTADFKIGINKFDLVINKTVDGNDAIDQVFIMAVKDAEGKTFNVTITPSDFANKTATKTIKGLYCGMNYTVEEDGNWSWRYTADNATQNVSEASNGAVKTTHITNTRTNNKWLSGQAIARNTFSTVWNAVYGIFN